MSLDSTLSNVQSVATSVQTGVNTATRLAADIGLGGVGGVGVYWKDQLRPASYGGVPFGVLGSTVRFGRRNVVHEYPYRDTVWVEDLGRAARRVNMRGFIVENAAYGGGSVIAQRDRLMAVCENAVDGELVHPTLGRLQVSNLSCVAEEKWDQGRVFELNFSFIESSRRIFPGVETSTTDAVSTSCAASDYAASQDFSMSTVDVIKQGAAVALQAVSTAAAWGRKAQNLVNDATNMFNMVSSLPGVLGRFSGGRNVSGLNGKATAKSGSPTSVSGLIAAGSVARSNVTASSVDLESKSAALDSTGIATSAQTLAASLYAAIVNPADAIRLLSGLADFTPSASAATSPVGLAMATMEDAMGDLFRRAAVIALARASSAYQPASADDAANIRGIVCALLDAEITIAGDQGQDATFNSFRATRSSVALDLAVRGAALATVTTITTAQSLPASVIAQRLYRDPTRADELVIQANPPHPAFMPTSFKALSK